MARNVSCTMSSSASFTCHEKNQQWRNFSDSKGEGVSSPTTTSTSITTTNRASKNASRIVYHEEDVKNTRENISTKTSTATGMTTLSMVEQEVVEEMRGGGAPPVHELQRQQQQEQPSLTVSRSAPQQATTTTSTRRDGRSSEDGPRSSTGQLHPRRYDTVHNQGETISGTCSATNCHFVSGEQVQQQEQEQPRQDHADNTTAKDETTCITHPAGCRAQVEEDHELAKSSIVPGGTTEQKSMNWSRQQDKLCRVSSSTRTVEHQQGYCNPVLEEKSQHPQRHFSPHSTSVLYPPTRHGDSLDTARHSGEKKITTHEQNHDGHSLPSSQQPPYMYYSSQRHLDAPTSGNDSMMSYYGHPRPSNYHACPPVSVPVQDYRPTATAMSQQPHCYSYTYPFFGSSSSVPFVPHEQYAMYSYYSPNFAVQHSNQHAAAPNNISTTTTLKQPSEYFHGDMRPVSSTTITGSCHSPASTSNLTGTIIDVNTSSKNAASLLDTPDSPMQKEDDPSKSGGSLDSPSGSSNKKTPRKKRKKKPKDCPRRPLSAYNFFFKDERKKILDAIPYSKARKKSEDDKVRESITWPGKKRPPHGKIGFENLAKVIGERWKHVDSTRLKYYKDLATKDLQRYAEEMRLYEEKQVAKRNKNRGSCANDEDETIIDTGDARTDEQELKNKRKISTCSLEHHSTKEEAPSKLETTKRRKPPTMKQQRKQNDSCDKLYQHVLEDGDISPQDIDQDDPFVNFDAASFVNSFSFDNEDLTSSGKVHRSGNNSSSFLRGIPFNESWIADLNQSESNE